MGLTALACLAAFLVILVLYWPALNGRFVFDDMSLPFALPLRDYPLRAWPIALRPALMISYWMNYRLWGAGPYSFHFVNLLIHAVNTVLVGLVLARLLGKAGWTERKARTAAIVGACFFMIHPLQTESVSYVAGRSESLAALFLLLAYVFFLYRRNDAISWKEACVVLVLFAIGVRTKENAVSLAAILLLTDWFWDPEYSVSQIKANWRLYVLMLPGVAWAGVVVWRVLSESSTAGFSVPTFRWYQYAFTEARAIFTYIWMTICPIRQSLDHDYPASRTITEHYAIVYLIVLLALIVTAGVWRRRFPVAAFGFLTFLIWLAPTSSVVPLDDALVERRMYLPLVGLILVGCEAWARLRPSPKIAWSILAAMALFYGRLCYDRNQLWGDPDKLEEAAAAQSVDNPRPLLNITGVLIQQNRCAAATPYLERAERRAPNNYYVNAAWGRVLVCLEQYPAAMDRFERARKLWTTSQIYEWIGLLYGKMGNTEAAGQALQKSVHLSPGSGSAHGSLALWYEKTDQLAAAKREYRYALSIDRSDTWAQMGLLRVGQRSMQSAP